MAQQLHVVTGAGGFVGFALAKSLRAAGHRVLALARGNYPELQAIGAESISVDLGNPKVNLSDLIAGAETVFHVAAKVEMWGVYSDFYQSNVVATENLLQACRIAGVRKFVFTSSPSVVASGTDLKGVDESQPYPKSYHCYYPQTKALAEQRVLAANSAGLWTVSLRPHLIFGPGDKSLVPTILERARAGRLLRVGSGKNLVDVCYIDDCVTAHLQAAAALDTNPNSRGRAYFISQGEPVNFWNWINSVLELNNLKPIQRSLPSL